MRLRSFATLLVCAVLAACEGDSILPALELSGQWVSNSNVVTTTFPDGTRPVQGRVEMSLGADGEFRREWRYTDPINGTSFPDVITEGTFTATEDRVHVTVTRAYFRQGGAPVPNATPQPITPTTDSYVYEFDDGKMIFTFVCPPNAICIQDPFPEYTRVLAEWR